MQNIGFELMCSGRVNIFCSNSGIRRVTVKGHEHHNSVTSNIVAITHSLNSVSFINVTYDICITLRVPVGMETLKQLRRQVYSYTKKIISKLSEKYNNVIIKII